jgi:hypothetical protein
VSLCARARKNPIHWSGEAVKAGDVRHERSLASKEGAVCASVIVVSEPKENANSVGLKSDKSV